jgi:hypothetical protein
MDQIHWGNTINISKYIGYLQQPGGAADGRFWTPFGKTIQPEQTQVNVVLEILQCIIKILFYLFYFYFITCVSLFSLFKTKNVKLKKQKKIKEVKKNSLFLSFTL